ncbi:MAG: PilZ domain-containing protein [Syntrophales bacterium]
MKENEKRTLERFDLEISAKIEVGNSEQDRKRLDFMTKDVCSGGAFFHTSQTLPEGTNVKIDLILPLDSLKKLNDDCKQAFIKVTGTVLRSASGGMAIRFNEDYQISPWGKE